MADDPDQHLWILAQIAGRVDKEDFLEAWLSASNHQFAAGRFEIAADVRIRHYSRVAFDAEGARTHTSLKEV